MNIIKDSRYGPFIFPDTDKYIGVAFNLYGEFSYQEVEFLQELIKPGDVVIDAGANIGGITVPLAQKIGPEGLMIAFEPQPYIFYILCGNVAINNLTNTTCLLKSVCDIKGDMRSIPVLDYEKHGSFGNNSTRKIGKNRTPVLTSTVDGLKLSKLNLIKVDVQGEELDVLKGGKETIERTRPFLYVESESKESSRKIVEFLDKLNYKHFFHRPPLFNPYNFFGNTNDVFDEIKRDQVICITVSEMIFAYPEEKKEWDKAIEYNWMTSILDDGR